MTKTIKKWLFLTFFLVYTIGAFLVGFIVGNASNWGEPVSKELEIPNFTSNEIFDSVNEHRIDIGLQALKLDEHACNFVVERYYKLSSTEPREEAHPGFDEFAFELAKESPYLYVGEIYTFANSPEESIQSWLNSPSHRFILEEPDYNAGCAYSDKGASVVILLELPE